MVLSVIVLDVEDGDIFFVICWFFSLDGDLGMGSLIDRNDLSVGMYILMVLVLDFGGLS